MKNIFNSGESNNKSKKFGDFRQGISKFFYLFFAGFLAIISSVLIFTAQPADAIDEIKITYDGLNIPIAIADLVTFAETGEQSEQLKSLFLTANATQENIDTVREILNYKLEVEADFVNTLLESRYGKLGVEEFSRYFAPDSNVSQVTNDIIDTVNRMISDGEISFLEMVQEFKWTDKIVIDAKGIETFFVETIDLAKRGLDFLKAQPQVQKLFCE
ncbi:alpha/beta hydrolase [Okeania sp. SIO2B3]|uniref:alpha/beta hydrolase n=1 Tax=Okeania sp. SIO2B3 TaxID=2607784 RepID=UPI0013C0D3B3|nr:alpha/beta hydrolase [Okeania sp. SIO2B3]NET45517.1 alpha/beta hydrolase [Okeania sp. SIO2B3]